MLRRDTNSLWANLLALRNFSQDITAFPKCCWSTSFPQNLTSDACSSNELSPAFSGQHLNLWVTNNRVGVYRQLCSNEEQRKTCKIIIPAYKYSFSGAQMLTMISVWHSAWLLAARWQDSWQIHITPWTKECIGSSVMQTRTLCCFLCMQTPTCIKCSSGTSAPGGCRGPWTVCSVNYLKLRTFNLRMVQEL